MWKAKRERLKESYLSSLSQAISGQLDDLSGIVLSPPLEVHRVGYSRLHVLEVSG